MSFYKFKKCTNTIIKVFFAPIRKYPIQLLFLSGLLLYPETYWCYEADSLFKIIKQILTSIYNFAFNNLLITTAIAYICVCISYIASKYREWLGNTILIIFHIIAFCLVFTDIFLHKFFGAGISAMMVKLVVETNSKEATDFFTTYIFNSQFLSILIGLAFAILLEISLLFCYRKFTFKKPLWIKIPIALYCVLAVAYFVYLHPVFSHDWRQNYIFIEENRLDFCSPNTEKSFVWSVNLAFVQYIYEKGEKDISIQSQSKVGKASVKSEHIANLVVIIGESDNRHHHSTYGYPLKTNQFTESIDGIIPFSNVITSNNVTAEVFQNMFSVASVSDTIRWCDVPFFPAIFKKSGFNVVFWSNQFVSELVMSNGDFSGDFLSNPRLREKCFSYFNTSKREYDGDFLNYYKEKRDSIEKSTDNLIIIHLAGQHVDPVTHFPPNRKVFSTIDYWYRLELNKEEKQQVANYDNCTLYVDSVVAEVCKMFQNKEAVVIYVPDHGDEANNYRPHIGRSYQLEQLGAPCLHCQFDIPFLVYFTPMCIRNHPDKYKQILEAKDKPFMTDDFPHLVFDLVGIQTKWYKPNLSPLSLKYNTKRHRVIQCGIDYDKVCDSYGAWKMGYSSKK